MTGIVTLHGREIRYVVRLSARARRLSLRIRDRNGVEVIVPRPRGAPGVEWVLRSHAPWILRTLDRMEKLEDAGVLAHLTSGVRLPLMGEARTLRIESTGRRRSMVTLTETEIIVHRAANGSRDSRTVLERWYRSLASVEIPRRVELINAQHGFSYGRITVRNQKTRWGSCSRKGTLSFNWRLVLLPRSVADYLICHELAHLKHMNHSPRFWQAVEQLDPAYRESERWLRRHGRTLLF